VKGEPRSDGVVASEHPVSRSLGKCDHLRRERLTEPIPAFRPLADIPRLVDHGVHVWQGDFGDAVALSWHQPGERLTALCRDGVLKVRCSVCDAVVEVHGEVDLDAARRFCATHRHDPGHPAVPEQRRH